MTWGNQLIANDAAGRLLPLGLPEPAMAGGCRHRRSAFGSGLGSNTTFLTGDARYQMSRDWGVGGVANVSRSDGGTAWSLEGYVDHVNALAAPAAHRRITRRRPTGRDTAFTLDQTWSTPTGSHLSTSASVERISGALSNSLQQDSTVLASRPTAAANSPLGWASKAMCDGPPPCRARPRRASRPMCR